jgi:hypothetical protein
MGLINRLNILNSSSLTDYRTAQRVVTTNKLVLGKDNTKECQIKSKAIDEGG